MDKYYVLIFQNTHNAIMGEKAFKEKDIPVVVMPTPTYITKSCGISLRINCEYKKVIKLMVDEEAIQIKNIFIKDGKEYTEISLDKMLTEEF